MLYRFLGGVRYVIQKGLRFERVYSLEESIPAVKRRQRLCAEAAPVRHSVFWSHAGQTESLGGILTRKYVVGSCNAYYHS